MFYPRLQALALLCAMCFLLPDSGYSQAQQPSLYTSARADWHLAGLAEAQSDWKAAQEAYNRVLFDVKPLPLHVREWFRGTSGYGIARCASRMNDPVTAKAALAFAFEHHFWNASLAKNDSIMVAACGTVLVDSLADFWTGVRLAEQATWHPQPPKVIYPPNFDSSGRWPLVIAMHGGNGSYENFAEYWVRIANLIGAVIVVPPGVIRESEITNSWGSDMDMIQRPILEVVNYFIANHQIDPKQIYLTGFSQGGQASIELTLRYPEIFRGAIAMAGFSFKTFPADMLEHAHKAGIRIFAMNGEYDDPTFLLRIQETAKQCQQVGIPFTFSFVKGMIHEVPLDLPTRYLDAWKWVRGNEESMIREQR